MSIRERTSVDDAAPTSDPATTRAIVGKTVVPLTESDPTRVGEIVLFGRFAAGSSATAKYCGRGDSWHFVKVLIDGSRRQAFDQEREIAALFTTSRCLPQFRTSGAVMVAGVAQPYFTQRWLPGPSLESLLRAGALPPDRVITLAKDLASAISDLADADYVHSDLKPSNIIEHQEGFVLVDLGSARRLSRSGDTTQLAPEGSLPYLAPEREDGSDPDIASDVFAWGLVLVEAATGTRPLPHGPGGYLPGSISVDAVPLSLREFVREALRPDPADRPKLVDLVELSRCVSEETMVLPVKTAAGETTRPLTPSAGVRNGADRLVNGLANLGVGPYRLVAVALFVVAFVVAYVMTVG